MTQDLKVVLAMINKKYGENTIYTLKDVPSANVERISSGSMCLDSILGESNGKFGWPLGRCVELYGSPSSGKSLISQLTIAQAQKEGLQCVYIDCENTFDPEFAKKLGVDTDKLIISQFSVGENVIDMICDLLKGAPDEKMVIVIDSVASMVPQKEIDEEVEKTDIALAARFMSKGLRKITALNKNALILFINQTRTNLMAYGSPSTTTGGNALKFYSSMRVEVRMGDKIEINKQIRGQIVKFKVVKNKTAAPFKDGYFKFFYDGTIDKLDEMVSLGLVNKAIKQSGPMYELCGQKFKGRETLERELEGNPEFYKLAKKEILK